MAKKTYGFGSARDVRRARKASRLVLDRRVMQPAKFGSRPVGSSVTEEIIQQGAGTCPCGTQYKRGSQSVTINSVAYEHATTYTVTTSCFTGTWPFPEVTFDSGSDWVSPEEELPGIDCYTGSIEGQLTLTPCGYETICSVDQLQAKIVLSTTLNDCENESAEAEDDVEATYICRNWNPLGPTATFELVGPTKVGAWTLPKFLCVTPKEDWKEATCSSVPVEMYASYIVDWVRTDIMTNDTCTLKADFSTGTPNTCNAGGVTIRAILQCSGNALAPWNVVFQCDSGFGVWVDFSGEFSIPSGQLPAGESGSETPCLSALDWTWYPSV